MDWDELVASNNPDLWLKHNSDLANSGSAPVDVTLAGSVNYMPGRDGVGVAGQINGTASFNVSGLYDASSTDGPVVMAWFRKAGTESKTLLSVPTTATNIAAFEVRVGTYVSAGWRLNDGRLFMDSSPTVVNDGEWHFLALYAIRNSTYTGLYRDLKVQVDGVDSPTRQSSIAWWNGLSNQTQVMSSDIEVDELVVYRARSWSSGYFDQYRLASPTPYAPPVPPFKGWGMPL